MSTSLGNTSLKAGINKTSSKVRPSPNKREFADFFFGEIILVAIGKDNRKRNKRQEARDKSQETRGKRQETRDKRQETRGKRQEARDKRQEARDKRQGTSVYNNL